MSMTDSKQDFEGAGQGLLNVFMDTLFKLQKSVVSILEQYKVES